MHDLQITDLEKDGQSVRFFWSTDPKRQEVGVHSFSVAGDTICSEALDRISARARWSQMTRAGWTIRPYHPVS